MIKSLSYLLFLLFAERLGAVEWRDIVYLKDGSVIKGTIIEQIPNQSLKILTSDENVFAFSMARVEKMMREKIEPIATASAAAAAPKPRRPRAPGKAWFFSALYPGIGQYYNGDVVKGVAHQLFFTAGWLSAIYFGTSYDTRQVSRTSFYYTYTYNPSCGCYQYVSTPYTNTYTIHEPYLNQAFYVGLGIAVAVSLWSQMDAPVRSAARNREAARKYGHLLEWEEPRFSLGLDFGAGPEGQAIGKFSLHL